MSATGFDTSWLNTRFAYDNAARNSTVEAAFTQYAMQHSSLRLLDIGAGTAANCLYFAERLPLDQEWWLVEQDAQLCQAARERLQDHYGTMGAGVSSDEKGLTVNVQGRHIRINLLNGSFFELEHHFSPGQLDVTLAAAVFDLLTLAELEQVLTAIFHLSPALFTTMNYTGMSITHSQAAKYIAHYEAHMQRHAGLGKDGAAALVAYAREKDFTIIDGLSQWQLDITAQRMHHFLLGFMENSIGEMLTTAAEQQAFDQWLAALRADRSLEMTVDHQDIWIVK